MERGLLSEHGFERVGVHVCDAGGVELTPETLLEDVGTLECLLRRHLLVECQANQQGKRIPSEQSVRVRIRGEVDGCHALTVPHAGGLGS